MRKRYKKVLKEFFHDKLFRSRIELGISQEEMASRLEMSNRNYIDLDHGKTCCSSLTFALFLIYICTDPLHFLEGLRLAFEKDGREAA